MKHITILVPNGDNNLSSIVGSYKVLSRANEYWKKTNGKVPYKIEVAGTGGEVPFHDGLFIARPNTTVAAIKKTNLIIIPSLNHNYLQAVSENEEIITWLDMQYRQGAEIASICTGAYLLAATGLIDGKSCSTHWSAANEFRTTYPSVKLKTDLLITDENSIYTNGGAYSFLNLLIYLVEKKYDRETALYCAKVFQVDMSRHSQSEFMIFTGQKQHNDDVVKQAQVFMEKHFDDKISVEELSYSLAVGRRNFDRRFMRATGNTPLEYLQRLKIEAAKRAFENTRQTVSEVMYAVGYSDAKAFREVFRKITGISPADYRLKYNKVFAAL